MRVKRRQNDEGKILVGGIKAKTQRGGAATNIQKS
jgi:hypothetical protein